MRVEVSMPSSGKFLIATASTRCYSSTIERREAVKQANFIGLIV